MASKAKRETVVDAEDLEFLKGSHVRLMSWLCVIADEENRADVALLRKWADQAINGEPPPGLAPHETP